MERVFKENPSGQSPKTLAVACRPQLNPHKGYTSHSTTSSLQRNGWKKVTANCAWLISAIATAVATVDSGAQTKV